MKEIKNKLIKSAYTTSDNKVFTKNYNDCVLTINLDDLGNIEYYVLYNNVRYDNIKNINTQDLEEGVVAKIQLSFKVLFSDIVSLH